MISREFLRRRNELFRKLKETGRLNKEIERMIVDVYGGRGKRALEVVKSGGVRKEGKRWFVRGKREEYEIVQTYCTCYDYVLNVVTGKARTDMCYHALAKKICEILDDLYR